GQEAFVRVPDLEVGNAPREVEEQEQGKADPEEAEGPGIELEPRRDDLFPPAFALSGVVHPHTSERTLAQRSSGPNKEGGGSAACFPVKFAIHGGPPDVVGGARSVQGRMFETWPVTIDGPRSSARRRRWGPRRGGSSPRSSARSPSPPVT